MIEMDSAYASQHKFLVTSVTNVLKDLLDFRTVKVGLFSILLTKNPFILPYEIICIFIFKFRDYYIHFELLLKYLYDIF